MGPCNKLADSETVSSCIARAPGQVEVYAQGMADLALLIHSVEADENSFREVTEKASVIAYPRLIRKLRKHGAGTEADRKIIGRCTGIIAERTEKLNRLAF